jgi:hypothetical protein
MLIGWVGKSRLPGREWTRFGKAEGRFLYRNATVLYLLLEALDLFLFECYITSPWRPKGEGLGGVWGELGVHYIQYAGRKEGNKEEQHFKASGVEVWEFYIFAFSK